MNGLHILNVFGLTLFLTESIESACDADWLEFQGNCYYVSNADNVTPRQDRTWRRSRDWCLTSGGDLASITSSIERRWLTNIAYARPVMMPYAARPQCCFDVAVLEEYRTGHWLTSVSNTQDRQYNGAMWIGLNSLADGNNFRWIDGNQNGYREWNDDEPRTDISAMCVAQMTRVPSRCFTRSTDINVVKDLFPDNPSTPLPGGFSLGYLMGRLDDVGKAECESKCADRLDCMAYTYVSNSEPLITFKGECLGANASSSQTHEVYRFSGIRRNCGDDQGLWYVANCGEALGFICKKTPGSGAPTIPPPTTPTPGYCPAGYFEASPNGGNKCFRIVHVTAEADDAVNWDTAIQLCRSGPGVLPNIASIQSSIETAVLTMRITDYAWGYYIGLRLSPSDVWLWSDNEDVSYTNWAAGKPLRTTARCAELWTYPEPVGTWNNQDCVSRRGYICQTYKDPGSPIITPPTTESNWCSRPGYEPYGSACYRMLTNQLSWTAAQAACRAESANMVTVNSESENAALIVMSYGVSEPMWIGAKKDAGGEWTWADGWPVVYTNWEQPSGQDPAELCGSMGINGKWKSDDCAKLQRAYCKISLDPVPTDPPKPDDGSEWKCPSGAGWEEFAGECYYVSTSSETTGNWATAAATCQIKAGLGHEATLASIHHDVVNTYIYNRLLKNNRQQAWIGLKKQGLGWQFEWVDRSAVQYLKWAPSEPNDKDGSQLCVEMYASFWPGLWNDHLCAESLYSRGFVCKAHKALLPTTPTSPPGLGCPAGCRWRSYGLYCYYIEATIRRSWQDAQKDCIQRAGRYGNLVTIGDLSTEVYMIEALQEEVGSSVSRVGFWNGLVRKNTNSLFQWIDGSPVNRTFWEPGEPNNQGTEHCTEMFSTTGLWNDRDCNHLLNYVCQVNKVDLGLTLMPPTRPDESVDDSGISITSGEMTGVVIGTALGVVVLTVVVVGAVVLVKGGITLTWR